MNLKRGVTLVELLVVIAIAAILAAVMAAQIRPALADRSMREATRQVNTYIAAAQARAAGGNKTGVWIERDRPNALARSYRMYIAEVPAPYAGDDISSRATITVTGLTGTAALSGSGSMAMPNFVQVGDYIKFNYRGALYPITSVNAAASTVTFTHPINEPNVPLPSATPPNLGAPFQIFRRPRKTSAEPLELPAGIVLELSRSGFGIAGNELSLGNDDVVLLFSPDGKLDVVYYNSAFVYPTAPLHLLLGKVEYSAAENLRMHNFEGDGTKNWKTNWVTISHRTGLVTSAESFANNTGTLTGDLTAARDAATRRLGMGGN